MKKWFLILVASFFLVTPSNAGNDNPKVVLIGGEELNKMIDDNARLVIIDNRYDKDYWDGHIKNAVNLPAESVDFSTLEQLADDMQTKLVFYCENDECATSKVAANKAIGAGYKYVYLYRGGFEDWVKRGYAVAK